MRSKKKTEVVLPRVRGIKNKAAYTEDLDADFISDDLDVVDQLGEGSEATARKRKSKERITTAGFKTMMVSFDNNLIALLKEIYEAAGLKYTIKNGEEVFKSAELSSMLSCLVTAYYNSSDFEELNDYDIYLQRILAIVKFRYEIKNESPEDICYFLNENKYKRYSSGAAIKNGLSSYWEPKHITVFITARDIKDVRQGMKSNRKKLVIRGKKNKV